MPQGRFNEYSPQEQAALARDMLQKSGRSITANNLNAAMQALMRNEELPSNNMDASIERTMQPRRPSAPQRTAAPQPPVAEPANVPAPNVVEEASAPASVEQPQALQAAAEPVAEPDLAAEFPGGGGSHSNVGGNTTVMQAIERMLLPLGIAAMLPSMGGAAPVAGAARSVAGTMQRGAMPPIQVSSARQGQAALPRPDADLRRRMIDRNVQRSDRNAARTRDERAAGNDTKGRRERIERVPEGEAAPAAKSSTIRLPPSRRRVSETSGNRRDAARDE